MALPGNVREAFENEPQQLQNEMDQVWRLIGTSVQPESVATSPAELDRRWDQLRQRIAEPERESQTAAPQRSARIFKLGIALRYAAAAAVTLLIGAYMFWTRPIVVEAGYGETAQAVLPDGSTIELNSGSSIKYARGFDGNPFAPAQIREVTLDGEAYFDIEKAQTPFVVHTFNADIRVLGTEFNVKAHAGDMDPSTVVLLAEGRVEVSARNDLGERLLLEQPGQTARVVDADEAAVELSGENLERALIWRNGGFAVQNAPLASVFAELERRLNVSISVQDPGILSDSLTILFSQPGDIETTLDDICSAKNLKYRAVSRGYMVYRP